MPVRDAEATLEAALSSILEQTEPRWECVLVDDGSRDRSRGIAERLAEREPRLRVLPLAASGIVVALNHGLEACRAPLVARMDADDVMHPERLRRQIDALEREPGLAAVGCHVSLFPRSSLTDGLRAYERWLNSMHTPSDVCAEAFVECPLAHPTLCVRRGVLAELGYRDCGWPEDYDLILRLLAAGHPLGVVAEPLLFWRDGPARLSRTHERYALTRFTECKAAHLASSFLQSSGQYVLWGYGDTGKTLSRALGRFGKQPSHIIELHPGRIGQRIAGAPVLSPDALPALAGRPLVASVSGATARAQIRAALAALGWREIRDFVVAA